MEIREYQTEDGKIPFRRWLKKLDRSVEVRIRARILRISETENLGDFKILKNTNGVCELKFKFGSGYRVYFAKDDDKIILLLLGGDKSTQDNDIKKATEYWRDYNA